MDREPVVALTAPWHERDTQSLAERLGAPVFVPRPTLKRTSCGSTGSLASRLPGEARTWPGCVPATCSRARASGGPRSRGTSSRPAIVVRWDSRRSREGRLARGLRPGLEIPAEWLRPDVTREQIVDGLRPLLELPVEFVLPAHGAPTDRAASSARSPEVGAELSAWVRRRRGAASRTTRHRLLSLRCAGHAAKLART
jgi:hypothetical protein